MDQTSELELEPQLQQLHKYGGVKICKKSNSSKYK